MWWCKDQCPTTLTQIAKMCGVPYAEGIRSVLWPVIISHPICAFAISILAQFIQNPGKVHWEVLKQVIAYLGIMKHLWLMFGDGSLTKPIMKGFCNVDWAGQPHQHLISGYSFHLGQGAVSWNSKKQLRIWPQDPLALQLAFPSSNWICWASLQYELADWLKWSCWHSHVRHKILGTTPVHLNPIFSNAVLIPSSVSQHPLFASMWWPCHWSPLQHWYVHLCFFCKKWSDQQLTSWSPAYWQKHHSFLCTRPAWCRPYRPFDSWQTLFC